MIKNNLKLRDIVSEHRRSIIAMLEVEYTNYYVAVDILEEIYRNNRKLIISDTEELQKICREINRVLKSSKGDISLRECKMLSLLAVFIETGNRKMVENYQIILKKIFNKSTVEHIVRITSTKKSSKEQEDTKDYYNVFQVLIYDLLHSMGEKKLLLQIKKPSNATINSLLLGIRNSNWTLKSKAFACIDFEHEKKEHGKSKKEIHCLSLILYDLNFILERLSLSTEGNYPKEVRIYLSNLIKILQTIEATFEHLERNHKLEDEESEETLLVVKIVERLHLLKSMCPLVVRKKISQLSKYVANFQQKIKKLNLDVNLLGLLSLAELSDFLSQEIKEEKLPLIIMYSEKIKSKRDGSQPYDIFEASKAKVEEKLREKIKWSSLDKEGIEIDQTEMQALQQFLRCLSNVNKSDPTVLSDNLKDFLMNFLRTSFLGDSGEKLEKMQNVLVQYDIPSVICSILEEPFKQRYKLFCSTTYLGIKLLEGGNSTTQQEFLQLFRLDGKNWIFQNLHSIINDCLRTIEFYYQYQEDPTIKSYEIMLEFEEVFTCKEERQLSCRLLRNTFQFLQLLCENDNHDMKEYIYNQLDREGHAKYMSRNFIEAAHTTMETLFSIIEYNIVELRDYPDAKFGEEIRENVFGLPTYILDFLIEVCQIPAEQNQVYLCRTDFFDLLARLIALKRDINEKKDSRDIFVIEQENMFFTLERKLIILLRSLLESDNGEIIDLLRNKVGNPEF